MSSHSIHIKIIHKFNSTRFLHFQPIKTKILIRKETNKKKNPTKLKVTFLSTDLEVIILMSLVSCQFDSDNDFYTVLTAVIQFSTCLSSMYVCYAGNIVVYMMKQYSTVIQVRNLACYNIMFTTQFPNKEMPSPSPECDCWFSFV